MVDCWLALAPHLSFLELMIDDDSGDGHDYEGADGDGEVRPVEQLRQACREVENRDARVNLSFDRLLKLRRNTRVHCSV